MHIITRHRRQDGFSLIEVLIAVVVLATGLLALAALQMNLTRNSADSKARSRVAGLLMSAIDDERASGYSSIAAFGATTCTTTTPTALQTAICTAQSDAGVSGLQLSQTVVRYCGASGTSSFTTPCPTPVPATSGEYKQVELKAAWTDVTNKGRSLKLSTIASAGGLTVSKTLLTQPLTTTASMTPVVHEANPSLTAGVIPIAVGVNTDSAATNPRPQLGLELAATSFNTLTYTQGANDTSSTSTIQKRVETTVAECVCGAATSTLTGSVFLGTTTFRPTYWNGSKYVSPAVPNPAVVPSFGPKSTIKQSDLCTQCCRDHHDTTADTVKFDSVTGDLSRYKAVLTTTGSGANTVTKATLALNASGAPIVATSSDSYLDACRVIRVDGLWRVATDMHAEHMGLLATATYGNATSATPDSSYATKYENFVIDFLSQKLNNLLNGGATPDAPGTFVTYTLDNPGTINATTVSSDYRYLHSRGLYVDHLEQPAIDKLTSINATCASSDFPNCLLPYLPFNTINVTELANWAPTPVSPNNTLTVTNTSTPCTTNAPIRGCVQGKSAGNGSANVSMGPSNSAVASSLAISPYDLASSHTFTDAQAFTITGTATSSEFFAVLSGLSQTSNTSTTDDPFISWNESATSGQCSSSFAKGNDTDPNPYDCVTTVALAMPIVVSVGSYNQVTQQSINNPCPGAQGNAKVSQPLLTCSTITAANVTGVPSGAYATSFAVTGGTKTKSEQTAITITGTPDPMTKSLGTLNVTFGPNGSVAGTYTCDVNANPSFTTPTTCP